MSALPPKSGHWNSVARCLLCAKSGLMQCSNWDCYSITSSASAKKFTGSSMLWSGMSALCQKQTLATEQTPARYTPSRKNIISWSLVLSFRRAFSGWYSDELYQVFKEFMSGNSITATRSG